MRLTQAQANALIAARRAREASRFSLEAFCFPKQLAFINDPARFKTACCSRRAGKTTGCAAHLLYTAVTNPGVACLYFTLTRQQAKRIIWQPLKDLNDKYKLGGVANESDLTIKFPNKSTIYISGAKDKTEVAKYLGYPLKLVYGDEAQSFRDYLRELIDDSIAPTLLDWAGTMVLMGTPGPVPVGYFYDLTQDKEWSNHHWTLYDNDPLRKQLAGLERPTTPEQLVADECKRRGLTLESPSIQRHFFGRWANDSTNLVFTWDKARNDYDRQPDPLEYVVGVDLGYNDADAIAVLGYNKQGVYLVEEQVTRKQGITSLAAQIAVINERYKPHAIVVDAGGLGKKIVEELIERFGLPLKQAEKTQKAAHIELVNDALRTGALKARAASVFVQDARMLEWDKDKSSGDRLVISDAFHSDICDAVLYAYRECLHWIPAFEKPVGPARHTEEYIEAAALRELKRRKELEEADPWSSGF